MVCWGRGGAGVDVSWVHDFFRCWVVGVGGGAGAVPQRELLGLGASRRSPQLVGGWVGGGWEVSRWRFGSGWEFGDMAFFGVEVKCLRIGVWR